MLHGVSLGLFWCFKTRRLQIKAMNNVKLGNKYGVNDAYIYIPVQGHCIWTLKQYFLIAYDVVTASLSCTVTMKKVKR